MSSKGTYDSLRVIQWLLLAIAVAVLVLPIALALFLFPDVAPPTRVNAVLGFLKNSAFLLVYCLTAFGYAHFYLLPRMERDLQRQAVVLSDLSSAPLARPQTPPLINAPTLPIAIRTRLNVRRLAVYFGPAMAMVVLSFVMSLLGLRNPILDGLFGFLGISVVLWLPFFVGSKPRFNIQQRITVTATDEYLLVTRGSFNFTIQWSEARLFSVIGMREEQPMVLCYALEGNGVTAEWWMCTRPPRWFDVARLGMPYLEYDRPMREILSVVSAKTGLPLLDLRSR